MIRHFDKSPSADSDRFYLSLWGWVAGPVDYLACAWRENGQWLSRYRFRYFTEPMHENRYEFPIKAANDSQAIRCMEGAFQASKSFAGKAGLIDREYYCAINGDMAAFKDPRVLKIIGELAWPQPKIPILYEEHASLAVDALASGNRDQYVQLIQTHGKREEFVSSKICLWIFDMHIVPARE